MSLVLSPLYITAYESEQQAGTLGNAGEHDTHCK